MHLPTAFARDFIAGLQPHADKRLVFECAGRRIQAGYHVTEIKAASYRSLDCGARPHQWEEVIVQLWDVADRLEEGYMPVPKFLSIWRTVDDTVGLNGDAEIKFECGDAVTPAVFYMLNSLREEGDLLIASLEPVRATCKPRDEWWLSRRVSDAHVCCASPNVVELANIASASPPSAAASCCR